MLSFYAPLLAALTTISPLLHAASWLGAKPTAQSLAGKVVVVDVFTFECINCKHVVPELRALRKSIPPAELAIVGVHSPETPYERDRDNVLRGLADQGITWPVAVDNDFAVWKAYGIQYWPTQLIFDRNGRLRKTVIGEGQDALVASTVRMLLSER
jgi:thiol-disulfide isomerase/thioredoxin